MISVSQRMPRREGGKRVPRSGETVYFRSVQKEGDLWRVRLRGPLTCLVPESIAIYFQQFRPGPVLLRHNLEWE